jgi:hypothetical protein
MPLNLAMPLSDELAAYIDAVAETKQDLPAAISGIK